MEAIVLHYHANFYTVHSAGAVYTCSVRGLLKKAGTTVLAGDTVELDAVDPVQHTARIAAVLPRRSQLQRPKIANVSQVWVVMAATQPAFDRLQLDRYLTHAALAGLSAHIVLTKMDLLAPENPLVTQLAELKGLYGALGHTMIELGLKAPNAPEMLAALKTAMAGQRAVLAGPSGVGKSTLINRLRPELDLAVGDVSARFGRGQHTTRHVSLIALDDQTYLADTPGFSLLAFSSVTPEAVEHTFNDFAPYRAQCRYDNCLHLEEVDCAVAANHAAIDPARWASYTAFVQEARTGQAEDPVLSIKTDVGYKTTSTRGQGTVQVVKLKAKHRNAARNTQKQRVTDWLPEEEQEDEPGEEYAEAAQQELLDV